MAGPMSNGSVSRSADRGRNPPPPPRNNSNLSGRTLSHSDSVEIRFIQTPERRTLCESVRRQPHWKCLLLTLLIIACLSAIVWCRLTQSPVATARSSILGPCDDGYIYIPVAFVAMLYLVYLVECWHSQTRTDLQYKTDFRSAYQHIASMQAAVPIVWWKAMCYHYVRRTRHVTRYRNGDAFTSMQVYYERINSNTSSGAFNFSQCGVKDLSKKIAGLEKFPATKIRITKGFSFACSEAEQDFERQRAEFFREQDRRDDYLETREGMDLLNVPFKKFMMAFAQPNSLPWYICHWCFWICSLLLFSWPLRIIIEFKTAHVHYHIHKHFGCNYPESTSSIGFLSRVSTMGSSEIEQTIRSNYQMVPSYSEALLMDTQQRGPRRSNTSNGSIRLLPLGTSVSLHNGVSSARTVIVPNNPRLARKVGTYGTIHRMPPTRSSDSLFKWKKKKKKRRHSMSGAIKREVMRLQPRPGDVIVAAPRQTAPRPRPRPVQAKVISRSATLPREVTCDDIIHHIRVNPTRCNHATLNCPLRNIPYRRRDAATLPGRRANVDVMPTIRQSRSEGRLSVPDLPPCYEDVVANDGRSRRSTLRASESFPCLDTSFHAEMSPLEAAALTSAKAPVECISPAEELPSPTIEHIIQMTSDDDLPLPSPPPSPDMRSSECPDAASTISESLSFPEPPEYSPPDVSRTVSPTQPANFTVEHGPLTQRQRQQNLEPFEMVFCPTYPS